ncbi:putative Disease resistance response protein [Corchorus olitorius]|uniref:Disease resistance response protein n=1 Tax=Corchorus olitorius TaxID=93759 RepID=A0A1R3I2I1_9ROSI|nr:putative Disease resistance response protein [Corchorus olitorius]
MAKFTTHSLVINFIIFSTTFHVNTVDGIFCEEVTNIIAIKREEKTTHLHFYFHDIVGGEKPIVVKIAGPSNSSAMDFERP